MNLIELFENCVYQFNRGNSRKEVSQHMVRDMGVKPELADEILRCFDEKHQLVTIDGDKVVVKISRH